MKQLAIAVAVVALMLAGAAPGFAGPSKKPAEVQGLGCVEAGIEVRCLMLKDLKTGKLYNLIIKGLQPDIGEGIEFVGVLHDGPNTCMQGIAVDVATWARKDSLRCKPCPAPREK